MSATAVMQISVGSITSRDFTLYCHYIALTLNLYCNEV
jgi:hypothetical protein